MPELPEVETFRKSLEKTLKNQKIEEVSVTEDKLVFQGKSKRTIVKTLKGATIKSCKRKGKYIWFELDRRPWPVFHLGMTGSYAISNGLPDKNLKSIKLILKVKNAKFMIYRDPRRFGRILLKNDPENDSPVAGLGPDVLNELPPSKWIFEHLQLKRSPIKGVLLDQSFMSGIGNWMCDEILFQSGIDPHRKANKLSWEDVKKLHSRIRKVTNFSVKVGADDEKYPVNWLFHHRWARIKGKTSSGEKIQHDTVAGRSTSWVPAKQK